MESSGFRKNRYLFPYKDIFTWYHDGTDELRAFEIDIHLITLQIPLNVQIFKVVNYNINRVTNFLFYIDKKLKELFRIIEYSGLMF